MACLFYPSPVRAVLYIHGISVDMSSSSRKWLILPTKTSSFPSVYSLCKKWLSYANNENLLAVNILREPVQRCLTRRHPLLRRPRRLAVATPAILRHRRRLSLRLRPRQCIGAVSSRQAREYTCAVSPVPGQPYHRTSAEDPQHSL